MKTVKLLRGVVIAAVVSIGVFTSQVNAAVSPKNSDDRAYLFEALRAMEKVESCYGEFLLEAKTPFGNANVMNKVEFYGIKNSVVKSQMDCVAYLPDGKKEKFSMTQYIQTEKDKIIYYNQIDNKWTKGVTDNAMKKQDNTFDQAIVDRMIKSAVIKDENKEWISLDVELNMPEVQKLYSQTLKELELTVELPKEKTSTEKANGLEGLSSKEIKSFLNAMTTGIEDFKINIVIDKKSKFIQGIYCDLSKPLQSGLTAAIGTLKTNDAEKAVYKAMASGSAVLVQGDFSKFNKVKKFTVPSDIVKNAVEEKLPVDKETGKADNKKSAA